MIVFSLLFLIGDLLLQQFKKLPNEGWVIVILLFSLLLFFPRNKSLKKLAALALGFAWTLFYAHDELSWVLPDALQGKTVIATGYIASIPNTAAQNTVFLFSLKKINNQSASGLVKLSWRYPQQKLFVGDKWQFAIRMKKIHGLMNPGGFDYEAWAFQEGIKAQGYIVGNNDNQIISHHWYHDPVNRIRQSLKEKIVALLPQTETSPWITALAVGERQNISQENWEVLRNTGTNHLMAIAGLHIGFMSGMMYFIASFISRRIPRFPLKIPAQHVGSIAALLMALIYSALSGFNIPAERASIMISIFLIVSLLRRKMPAWHTWSIAVLIVLILNPLCVLSDSFWLSFGSVALIIYGVSGRLHPTGLWWKWGRIQWVIAVGLIPLSIALFQQISLIAFVANSIAIPWVACIIVPLSLLGCFCLLFSMKLSAIIFILADKNLALLWKVLAWFSHLPWATWYQFVPSIGIVILACAGVILLLLPKGFPGRWFGLIWLLPLFLYRPSLPKVGEVWFTLFDVGQGLAALVETNQHILIFDTGARLSDNYDMGESVIIPYLHVIHANAIDMMVISHSDNDHIGGSFAILKQIPVKEIKTSVPEFFSKEKASFCLQNQSWNWDGVEFKFLSPTQDKLDRDDNSSCVLKISTTSQSILLTGDIEKQAEKDLVINESPTLKSTILVAPHHGSKSSAEESFLTAVDPEYVLFPVGYRNRYHFPNALVVARYHALGAKEFDTVNDGAIQFKLFANTVSSPELYRLNHWHYWN